MHLNSPSALDRMVNAGGSRDAGAEPPRSTSPSNSFYAVSDDEERGYDTITHTETGKGVRLLFSKSKVSMHPAHYRVSSPVC